jgi:hypothetical protein
LGTKYEVFLGEEETFFPNKLLVFFFETMSSKFVKRRIDFNCITARQPPNIPNRKPVDRAQNASVMPSPSGSAFPKHRPSVWHQREKVVAVSPAFQRSTNVSKQSIGILMKFLCSISAVKVGFILIGNSI